MGGIPPTAGSGDSSSNSRSRRSSNGEEAQQEMQHPLFPWAVAGQQRRLRLSTSSASKEFAVYLVPCVYPDRGFGVVTKSFLPKGTRIPLLGREVKVETARKDYPNLVDDYCLDTRAGHCWLPDIRRANLCIIISGTNVKEKRNCEFKIYQGNPTKNIPKNVHIVTIRDVVVGEELLLWCGGAYCSKLRKRLDREGAMLADRDGASGNSCDVCGKNFSSKLKFAAHVKEHEKQEGIDDDEGGEGGGEMEKEEKGEKKGEEKKGEKEEEEKEEASGSGRGEEEEDERVPRSMTSRRTRSRKGKESSRLVGDSSPAGRRREKEKETKKVKEVVNLDQVEEEKEEVQSNKTGRDEKDLESEEVSKRGDKGDDSGQESGKEDGSSEKGGEEKSETEGGADNESATAPIKLTKCRKCGQKFTSVELFRAHVREHRKAAGTQSLHTSFLPVNQNRRRKSTSKPSARTSSTSSATTHSQDRMERRAKRESTRGTTSASGGEDSDMSRSWMDDTNDDEEGENDDMDEGLGEEESEETGSEESRAGAEGVKSWSKREDQDGGEGHGGNKDEDDDEGERQGGDNADDSDGESGDQQSVEEEEKAEGGEKEKAGTGDKNGEEDMGGKDSDGENNGIENDENGNDDDNEEASAQRDEKKGDQEKGSSVRAGSDGETWTGTDTGTDGGKEGGRRRSSRTNKGIVRFLYETYETDLYFKVARLSQKRAKMEAAKAERDAQKGTNASSRKSPSSPKPHHAIAQMRDKKTGRYSSVTTPGRARERDSKSKGKVKEKRTKVRAPFPSKPLSSPRAATAKRGSIEVPRYWEVKKTSNPWEADNYETVIAKSELNSEGPEHDWSSFWCATRTAFPSRGSSHNTFAPAWNPVFPSELEIKKRLQSRTYRHPRVSCPPLVSPEELQNLDDETTDEEGFADDDGMSGHGRSLSGSLGGRFSSSSKKRSSRRDSSVGEGRLIGGRVLRDRSTLKRKRDISADDAAYLELLELSAREAEMNAEKQAVEEAAAGVREIQRKEAEDGDGEEERVGAEENSEGMQPPAKKVKKKKSKSKDKETRKKEKARERKLKQKEKIRNDEERRREINRLRSKERYRREKERKYLHQQELLRRAAMEDEMEGQGMMIGRYQGDERAVDPNDLAVYDIVGTGLLAEEEENERSMGEIRSKKTSELKLSKPLMKLENDGQKREKRKYTRRADKEKGKKGEKERKKRKRAKEGTQGKTFKVKRAKGKNGSASTLSAVGDGDFLGSSSSIDLFTLSHAPTATSDWYSPSLSSASTAPLYVPGQTSESSMSFLSSSTFSKQSNQNSSLLWNQYYSTLPPTYAKQDAGSTSSLMSSMSGLYRPQLGMQSEGTATPASDSQMATPFQYSQQGGVAGSLGAAQRGNSGSGGLWKGASSAPTSTGIDSTNSNKSVPGRSPWLPSFYHSPPTNPPPTTASASYAQEMAYPSGAARPAASFGSAGRPQLASQYPSGFFMPYGAGQPLHPAHAQSHQFLLQQHQRGQPAAPQYSYIMQSGYVKPGQPGQGYMPSTYQYAYPNTVRPAYVGEQGGNSYTPLYSTNHTQNTGNSHPQELKLPNQSQNQDPK